MSLHDISHFFCEVKDFPLSRTCHGTLHTYIHFLSLLPLSDHHMIHCIHISHILLICMSCHMYFSSLNIFCHGGLGVTRPYGGLTALTGHPTPAPDIIFRLFPFFVYLVARGRNPDSHIAPSRRGPVSNSTPLTLTSLAVERLLFYFHVPHGSPRPHAPPYTPAGTGQHPTLLSPCYRDTATTTRGSIT